MPLRAETRQENLAGGLKGLAAGPVVAEAVAEWQRQWWWWHTVPMNKHPRPVRIIRLPVLWVTASEAARRWFNCSWKGERISSHCVFMFMQCWQQVEPESAEMQSRLLKYMNKKLNKWKKAKSAGNIYRLWCWCWAQWRQQSHRREIEDEQDSRVMLMMLKLLEAKQSEDVQGDMLLV